MRICLAVHGFPPLERTGVENYTAALAAELARQGHAVEVFAPRVAPELPHLSTRREVRDGYGITWLSTNVPPRGPEDQLEPPGVAARFGAFLDRERPDVVHFQHLVKLGVGLIAEARARDVPTLYTAHDFYPVCHRYTLLRPNLTRCDVIGDAMVCARCDLALGALNAREELGDYQMGVLAEQLEDGARAGLDRLLDDGDPEALGLTLEELDAAFDRRQVLDGRRAEAFASIDLVLAPTAFLAERLRLGGLDPARVRVLGYGIDASAVAAVPPVARGAQLRLGFLSGMSKHKGAHLLLEAYARMRAPAELHLFGGSTDAPYVERVRARARELGAVWHGAFDRDGLPAALAAVDAVCVPSLWYENQPLAILESFAAGRPVVVPRLGAFPENVEDGVQGLLFAPDDPEDLARALDRLAEEPGLLERLAEGARARAPKAVEPHARELAEIYAELARARRAEEPAVLPSLAAFAREHAALERRSTRALMRRALRGLDALRPRLGLAPAGAGELLIGALGSGSRAQEELRDREQERDWLTETLAAARREAGWMQGALQEHEDARRDLDAERRWLREQLEAREQEARWLRETLAAKDAELEWLRRLKSEHERQLEDLRAQMREIARIGERLGEHLRSSAEVGLEALEARGHVLGDDVKPLLEVLRRAVAPDAAAHERADQDTRALDALVSALSVGLARLLEIEHELFWRRDEMRGAAEEAQRRPAAAVLRLTGLGRRALRWREGGWHEEDA